MMAAAAPPQRFRVEEQAWSCAACRGDLFHVRRTNMPSPMASFFNLDAFTAVAQCLVCADCGHIDWFLEKPAAPEPLTP